ncbi:NAD(P)/FAD-dependent oxidoreductase [uncultured Clostridium sp.]|uniref:NAD(P)/FAD-dependent oxidoreductase n=1 Tax=uncultured Clostridium sp. TaxID=59620 RepID=UPI00261E5D69|nr:NAD(P)/FAD-dependent oxidoreductase [uncultured Clostridium sp.]
MKDIIIIGGGVVGCSIGRELAKYDLDISLLEKNSDVAEGISKANSGIVHAGYNEKLGTLKGKFNIEGNKMFDKLAKDLDFSFKRNGALVLAFNREEVRVLEELKSNGEKLGVDGLEILSLEEVKSLEKNVGDKVCKALYVKNSGIVNPYEMTVAMAENACENGVHFKFEAEVIDIKKMEGYYKVVLKDGEEIEAKLVINAAGINSDKINNLINEKKYTHELIKGEYCLLDKVSGGLIHKTIFRTPSKMGKGILVTKTVDGNLLIGPTAKKVYNEGLENTKNTLDEIMEKANESVANINRAKILTTFAGLRPHLEKGDFVIDEEDSFISLVGIESPGLTAAPAIAKYVKDIVSRKIELKKKKDFIQTRKGIIKFAGLSIEEKNKLIKEKQSYGKIICKCELITEGEIVDAINRPLGAKTVDGVKRRTRATMGGCQGTGCLLPISKIISRELGIPITEVNKNSKCSNVIGFKEA